MKFALLLLPVLENPNDNKDTNGFDAPAKKRKRTHAHSKTRPRGCNGMEPAAFDAHCRTLAREEIVKTLKLAEAIEAEQ
jgi:hypothetical protein